MDKARKRTVKRTTPPPAKFTVAEGFQMRATTTTVKVAEVLGVSIEKINRLCRDGELESYKLTGGDKNSPRRIYVDSVVAFAKEKQGRDIAL